MSLSDAAAQSPSFTAPSVRGELEFSLVVNDGENDSAPDAVAVRVRPPLNPTSAPCEHPAPTGTTLESSWVPRTSATDTSVSFSGPATNTTYDLYFCWPDGRRVKRAAGVLSSHIETVSGLASGVTYWVTLKATSGSIVNWSPWEAVTTTGGASIRGVSFTSSPAEGNTYLIGEAIRAEATWSQAVVVDAMGDDANVSLRLDLGTDDADLSNSRRKMAYVSGSGTDTLTFEYTVQPEEMDGDGVWLQTDSDTVVFLENGATVKGATRPPTTPSSPGAAWPPAGTPPIRWTGAPRRRRTRARTRRWRPERR